MGSVLRVRSRHLFGSGSNGMSLQHSYEITHMCVEVEDGEKPDLDDIMRKFYALALPVIECVEQISFYFSKQFEYRLEWGSESGDKSFD